MSQKEAACLCCVFQGRRVDPNSIFRKGNKKTVLIANCGRRLRRAMEKCPFSAAALPEQVKSSGITRFSLRRQMDVWSHDLRTLNRKKRSAAEQRIIKKPPEAIRGVKGNLRFPLDLTYHGCPYSRHPYVGAGLRPALGQVLNLPYRGI